MGWIRRDWTPEAADDWKKEDWIAVVLSSLSYMGLMLGVALAFLLMWEGFVILVVTLLLTWLMFRIIDPKLGTISREYESRQRGYVERLEKITRWEGD